MKNKWLMTIASVLSLLWIVFVILLFTHNCPDYSKYDLPDDANELGDFLAGVFSPLAFLWLIVGYFLQARELNLTREELSSQTKALIAQSKAASKGVKLEEENQRAEQERRDKLAAPILQYRRSSQKVLNETLQNGLEVVIVNTGGNIKSVKAKFYVDGASEIKLHDWPEGAVKTIKIRTDEATLEEFLKDGDYHLQLIYTDIFNREQKKRYLFRREGEVLEEIEDGET